MRSKVLIPQSVGSPFRFLSKGVNNEKDIFSFHDWKGWTSIRITCKRGGCYKGNHNENDQNTGVRMIRQTTEAH